MLVLQNKTDKATLLALLKVPNLKVLIIEDHQLMRTTLTSYFTKSIEGAAVRALEDPLLFEIEIQRVPQLILIDAELGTYKNTHPSFGSYGPDFIPYIREQLPNAFIVSISTKTEHNGVALLAGAHAAIEKHQIAAVFNNLLVGE